MQEYVSMNEFAWLKISKVDLTEKKNAYIAAIKNGNNVLADSIDNEIKSLMYSEPTSEEVEFLNQRYLAAKPQLLENDTYQFIAMNVFVENTTYKSILNCRVNNQHLQIRS